MLVDLSQVAENGFGLNRESNLMDGIHDLGGKAGFGKVEAEEDEHRGPVVQHGMHRDLHLEGGGGERKAAEW